MFQEDEELLDETVIDSPEEETDGEPQENTEEAEQGAEEGTETGADDTADTVQNVDPQGMDDDQFQEELFRPPEVGNQAQKQLDRLTTILKGMGYDGDPQEIADVLEAQHREIEPEQVRQERETVEARAEADRIRMQAIMAKDLAEIRTVDPNIKSLHDLGDTFFKLRGAGLENLEAYQLVAKLKEPEKPARVNTGKEHLKTTGGGTSSGGLVDIPRSEFALWRESFPDESPTKLKERYNRAMKRQGG